jgi:hypothetical protein
MDLRLAASQHSQQRSASCFIGNMRLDALNDALQRRVTSTRYDSFLNHGLSYE